jgi:shikimate kinase
MKTIKTKLNSKFTFLLCFFISTTCMSQETNSTVRNNDASVEMAEGMNVFLQARPSTDFQVLGDVKKTGLVWSGKPKEMYRIILRRAKKDYPQADGIIFEDIDMDHATVIKSKNENNKSNKCTVEMAEGMFVFLQSRPESSYQTLGTVKKTGLVWSGKPKEMYRIILRRAKKDYPEADGIIFEDIDMDHATVIKFK